MADELPRAQLKLRPYANLKCRIYLALQGDMGYVYALRASLAHNAP